MRIRSALGAYGQAETAKSAVDDSRALPAESFEEELALRTFHGGNGAGGAGLGVVGGSQGGRLSKVKLFTVRALPVPLPPLWTCAVPADGTHTEKCGRSCAGSFVSRGSREVVAVAPRLAAVL